MYARKETALNPDQVFLTASTSEAYSFLLKLFCDPGERVLVPEPSYPLFDHLTDLERVERIPYRLRPETGAAGWEIDLGSVERGLDLDARLMILVHPNNPTGSYVRRSELSKIVSMLDPSVHALIRDEVFSDFPIEDCAGKAGVVGTGSEEVLTFSLGGLSKSCGLPQMKLAWIIVTGPETLRREAMPRLELIADTYLSVGAPVQAALPRLLELGEKAAERIRRRIRENHAYLRREYPPESSTEGLRLLPVEAGWSAPLELPSGWDEEKTVVGLLEQKDVFVQPGWFFAFSGGPRIVVSLLPEPEIFAEGLRRISAFLSETPAR